MPWCAANLQARNATLLRSNCMACTLLNTVVDKGRRFFGSRSTQKLPGDFHSATNPLSSPQKKFKKSNDARRDMSVLAMAYILQDSPTIRELIRLIIGLNDHDDSGKLSEVLAISVKFTVQLASFYEEGSSKPEALTAVTTFLATIRDIDAIARGGTRTGTGDNMNDMMKDSIKQIKITHPALGNRSRNIGDYHGLSGILDTIIDTTSTILIVFNEASDLIPVPFVHSLVASVASLLSVVQQTRSNHDDMRQMAALAGEFVVMLAETCAGDEMKPSRSFRKVLGRLENKLRDIAQQCDELSRHNVFWRFFQQGADLNSISSLKQDLQNAIAEFQTNAQLLQHLDLRSMSQVINRKLDEDAVNALPKSLTYIGRRDEYFPGSRSDDIQVIADWLENPDQVAFWMRGGAGLGKSTLALKIVDSLRADDRLATFAFLPHGTSGDPATVIQSMARELGVLHPRAIPQIATAARTCSSGQSLHEYIEAYLITSIHSLSYPYPLVIVIDGLDEWEHCEAFLKELEYILRSSSVKILLTNRPNHSIERSLINVATQKYQLPPVSQAITEAYFNHHFAKMDWEMRKPSPIIVSNLARLADGLLVWAAMVCSFLSYEMREGAPHELLDQILSPAKQITLQGQLSNLYRDALTQLFQNDKERQLFKRVFGAMTVLQESLPLHDFACLLGMSHNQVSGVQSRLTALQTRGAFHEQIVPPASERFHSSIIEFTMNRETEAGIPLIPCLIDPQTAHQSMAEGCLSFLNDFLSSFRGRECRHSDLRGLELYAVKFWPLHMANSSDRSTPLSPKLDNLLLELPENHLRQWGSWFLAISIPASSQNWDQVLGPSINKDSFYYSLAGFLKDNIMTDTALASSRTFCLEIAIRLQPERLEAWEDLGDSYVTRFENNSILDLLNHAIIVYRHALELSPKDGSQCTCMFGLASALWYRFGMTGSMVDLNEAILLNRETLSLLPTLHPVRPSSLTSLGLRLWDRFRRTGSMADLEEAILMHRESLSLCPIPHPNRSASLNNLGIGLMERFSMNGFMADLKEAILVHRESLFLCPTPHPCRSFSLSNLANALLYHSDQTDLTTDLRVQEAILLHRESLSLRPTSHPCHSDSLYNVANALQKHFRRKGSMTDLEEAILLHRESLSFRPAPHPNRFESLNGLACALWDRFGKTGSMTDLEEAISMLREALPLLAGPAATHPHRLLALNHLATFLETRLKRNGGHTSDFEEVISLRREILAMSK